MARPRSTPPPSPPPSVAPPPRGRWRALLPFALVIAAGLFAWWGVWGFEFLFDDEPAIENNDALLAGDWWNAAFGPKHHPLANRPLSCLSLAVDLALFRSGPFGPHFTNLLLHVANALLLFVLARDTLRAPNLAGHFGAATARRLALAIACLWVVHPLATDAVAYATQRSTLLASGLLLAALWATRRAEGSRRAAWWRAAAVAALALGMASKEDLVGGPVLVVLYERAFLVSDWRSLRAQWRFHAALATTWLVLAFCVAMGPHNGTVGYDTRLGEPVTALEWLQTQAAVVVHYVRLAVWPAPLRGAYDVGIVRDLALALLPGALVLALLAATIVCWRRWPWWGWLGAWFFVGLAPTSSVLPIVTEIVAERRAYLPMLAVLVPLVVGGHALLARAGPAARALGPVLVVAAVAGLALLARGHAGHYATEAAFWADAYGKRDTASRTTLAAQILSNYGMTLSMSGRAEEAWPLFDLAMRCESPTYPERTLWAASLQQRGRLREAIAALEQAIAGDPELPNAYATLGTCLLLEFDKAPGGPGDARLQRATECLRRAGGIAPRRVATWNALGAALLRQEKTAEAEAAYARACALPYERSEPFVWRARALRALGRADEAQRLLRALRAARPRDLALRRELVTEALAIQDRAGAIELMREVVGIDPSDAKAAQALRGLEAAQAR